jgi:hypothetical protein
MSASIGSVPPEPSRVWLVREGDPRTTEGKLSLEGTILTFESSMGSEPFQLPAEQLRGIRRRRGTPVLTMRSVSAEGEERLYFYFAKPPPLPGERRDADSVVPGALAPRGLERSAAALTMRQANRLLKEEIEGWVRALRAAGTAS